MRSVKASGVQICGKYPAACRLASVPASILSVLTCAWAIAFTCKGLAMITRATNGVSTREAAMLLPVASITTSSVGPQALAQPFERSPGHVDPAGMSQNAILPNHHLAKGPVNINPNHASHARLPMVAHDGSGGRHDTYGSALTAQPGESQRRPANASSQLIVQVGLPAPSCSRRPCPGWSHHTPQSSNRSRDKRRRHRQERRHAMAQ